MTEKWEKWRRRLDVRVESYIFYDRTGKILLQVPEDFTRWERRMSVLYESMKIVVTSARMRDESVCCEKPEAG